jgi:hypothetical protein
MYAKAEAVTKATAIKAKPATAIIFQVFIQFTSLNITIVMRMVYGLAETIVKQF